MLEIRILSRNKNVYNGGLMELEKQHFLLLFFNEEAATDRARSWNVLIQDIKTITCS